MIIQKQYKLYLYSSIILTLNFFLAQPLLVTKISAQSGEAIIYYKDAFKSKNLSGYVCTPSGSNVSNVKIEVMDDSWSKKLQETNTDSNGYFSLSGTKKGLYYLQLSKNGFNTIRLKVKITSQKNAEDELSLKMSIP